MLRLFGYNRQVQHETGSDAEQNDAWAGDYTGAMYCETGHEVPVQTVGRPFYGVNAARNNGADIEPIPITPVRAQNWPEMQIQMHTGWDSLSFGRKLSYDSYLRMLTDSATKQRNYLIPSPSGIGPSAGRPGPAPANVNQLIQNGPGQQPPSPGGPGMIASGVNFSGRTYYG